SVPLAGTVVASDPPKKMVLLRVNGELRETQLVKGVYPDTWSGPEVEYTRLHCRGGSVSVLVSSDPHLFRGPQELRAFGRTFQRLTLTPTEARTVSVPLLPAAEDRCTARFSVFPTAVPGNGDPRELGL